MTDAELLKAYLTARDSDAFGRLAARYHNLVFAAARRQIGDSHLADDVAQAVFLMLARKAQSVRPEMLAGWLIHATRLAAKTALRGEIRRRKRELRAATMKQQTTSDPSEAAGAAVAERLDDALASLRTADRTAVTLRYLQGCSGAEVAAAMGLSEAAARQRISRGVAKLRDFLVKRDTDVPAAAIIALMDAQSRISAPAVTSVSADAKSIASAALGTIARRKLLLASSAALVVAVLIALLLMRPTPPGSVQARSPSAAALSSVTKSLATSTPTSQPRRPIRVGVYLSHFTATGPSWVATPYGYYAQTRTLEDLRAVPDLILQPVVEPNTETLGKLPLTLQSNFGSTPVTDVTSVEALRRLDVIVFNHVADVPPEALDAIEAAVKAGTGLYVRQHMGTGEPGFTPQVKRMLLLAEGQYGWNPRPVECEIVGEHPILGSLSGRLDRVINLYANGPYGILAPGATPLIRVKTMTDISPVGRDTERDRTDFVHCPLYVGEYGKGRVVVCSFAAFGATPQILQNATQKQFTANCVRWAGRQDAK